MPKAEFKKSDMEQTHPNNISRKAIPAADSSMGGNVQWSDPSMRIRGLVDIYGREKGWGVKEENEHE